MVTVTRYTDCRETNFHCSQESLPARSAVATENAALSWLSGSKANGYCLRVGFCSCDMQCEDYGTPITRCPVGRVFGRLETCGSLSMCPSHRLNGLGPPQHSRATPRPLSIFFPWVTLTPRIIVFQTYLNDHID